MFEQSFQKTFTDSFYYEFISFPFQISKSTSQFAN